MRLYSLYDAIKEIYNTPFSAHNDNDAIRSFITGLKEPSSMMYHSPEDFSLHVLADIDLDSGEITPVQSQTLIYEGKATLEPNPEE